MKEVIPMLPHHSAICLLIKNAFSDEFCQQIITNHKETFNTAKTHYPTSYRNNERQVKDDILLAEQLFQSIKPYLPQKIEITGISSNEKGKWALLKLNTRLRICRYLPKQYFNKHLDGIYYESEQVQSKLTFMIYLNGQEEFKGGRTLFFNSKNDDTIIGDYEPVRGDLMIFDHNLWHSGELLEAGEKYILRSDILYQRSDKLSFKKTNFCAEGHLGYIWVITKMGDRFITSGRDKQIKIWSKEGQKIDQWTAHQNSILTLLSLNNETFISASRDQTIKVWCIVNQGFELKKELKVHEGTVLCLCKKEEKYFYSGGADGVISFIDIEGKIWYQFQAHDEWIWGIKLLNKETLVSVGEDGKVKLWNTLNHTLGSIWEGSIPINSLVIDTLNNHLYLGRLDGSLLVLEWNILQQKWHLKYQKIAHAGIIRCLKLHGNYLISGGEDNLVKVWDVADLSFITSFEHDNFVQDVIVEGTDIISVSYDGKIKKNRFFAEK